MLKYLTVVPEKLHNILDAVQSASSKFILILAIIVTQFVLLGTYSSVDVFGQDDQEASIDVNGMFGNGMDISCATSGDCEANLLQLRQTDSAASVSSGLVYMYGVDAVEGASARADELGMNDTLSRNGLLNTVDQSNVALLVDPVGVDIPGHFANQWLPGSQTQDYAVYAQGGGYNFFKNDIGLEPVWEMFRDIAYAGFVVVLMAAGFMIMFRSKIGGQVTVGVMNTIPGVIMGLVLVTFSFSIVGFIVDMARLFSFLLIKLMESNLVPNAGSGFSLIRLPNSPFVLMAYAFKAVPLMRDFTSPVSGITGALLWVVGPIFTIIAGIIALIVAVAALYACFKIYVMLITTYVKIIIDLVFGPLFILMGSLPGKSKAILDWIKRVAANALVFPVTLFAFNLVRYIGYSSVDTSSPMTFMSGGSFNQTWISLRGAVVIAGLFLLSGIPDMIQEALQAATPKSVAGAAETAKKNAGKIPLVGGLFG